MSKIVVICPFKNEEKYIGETVDSLNSQTYRDFEAIFVDDGSTDRSSEIILTKMVKPFRIMRNEVSIGPSKSINRAIAASDSEYLARLDGDDVMHPEKLKLQVAVMEDRKDLALLGTRAIRTDAAGKPMLRWLTPPLDERDIRFAMNFYNPIISSSVLFRRRPPLKTTPVYYEPSTDPTEDFAFARRYANYGSVINLRMFLLKYRVRPGGITTTKREAQLRRHLLLLEKGGLLISRPTIAAMAIHCTNILRMLYVTRTLDERVVLLRNIRSIPNIIGRI